MHPPNHACTFVVGPTHRLWRFRWLLRFGPFEFFLIVEGKAVVKRGDRKVGVLGPGDAIGELGLLLPALAALTRAGKRIVWLAPPHLPYAPALAAAGLDLARLAVVRVGGRREALWAAEPVLRSGSCQALLAWLPAARYDDLRRLALAAESGRAWAALYRPPQAAQAASPAPLRLALEPAGDALSVHILKRRGAPSAAPLRLPLPRPVHALARTALPIPAAGHAGGDRRLGVPVHA